MLRAALIGYGYWGHILEGYIRQSKYFQLQAIYDHHQTSNDTAPFVGNITSIIEDRTIDVVFVATPTSQHFDICKSMLQNGKHVFCEKPATVSYSQWDELRMIAAKSQRILFIDYLYIYSPGMRFIKQNLPSIGKLQGFYGEIKQFGRLYPRESVYGIIGLHILSAMAFLADSPITRQAFTDISFSEEDVCTCGVSQVLFSNQVNAALVCDLVNAHKTRYLKVFGEKGAFFYQMNEAPTVIQTLYKDSNPTLESTEFSEFTFDECNTLTHSLNAFARCIRQGDADENQRIADTVQKWLEVSLIKQDPHLTNH